MAWLRELEVATKAARKAAEVAQKMQSGITAEWKPDHSPVTAADRECERLIAGILSDAFPEDGILGEEGARSEPRSGRTWIIDPIDGTRDYLRGNALWANLIALEADGEVAVGVVNLPVLGNLYMGGRGSGAFRDNSPIHVSSKNSVEESVICFNQFSRMNRIPFQARLEDWMNRCWAVRGLGGAADAMMVASGQAELWLEPRAAAWDFAPLKIIAEEAGGRFLNFDGAASIRAGNALVFTPGIETEVRRMLELPG
ncbi:MAG TPA: inositol monophosphatase [Bryobacteraceae bacterium]|nr:inositol monophosphatase [Bryobacteraceae bacterium]